MAFTFKCSKTEENLSFSPCPHPRLRYSLFKVGSSGKQKFAHISTTEILESVLPSNFLIFHSRCSNRLRRKSV
jgi:hypothetical protein